MGAGGGEIIMESAYVKNIVDEPKFHLTEIDAAVCITYKICLIMGDYELPPILKNFLLKTGFLSHSPSCSLSSEVMSSSPESQRHVKSNGKLSCCLAKFAHLFHGYSIGCLHGFFIKVKVPISREFTLMNSSF